MLPTHLFNRAGQQAGEGGLDEAEGAELVVALAVVEHQVGDVFGFSALAWLGPVGQ